MCRQVYFSSCFLFYLYYSPFFGFGFFSDLLHLSPKSPEAQVFEGLGNSSKTNSSTAGSSVEKGSSSEEKSGGALGKRWVVAEMVSAILPFVFISHFFIIA